MVYHKFELDHVNIKLLYETSEIPVRLLSSTGKLSLESDFYKSKKESVWGFNRVLYLVLIEM
jgi:hypothetical protein